MGPQNRWNEHWEKADGYGMTVGDASLHTSTQTRRSISGGMSFWWYVSGATRYFAPIGALDELGETAALTLERQRDDSSQ